MGNAGGTHRISAVNRGSKDKKKGPETGVELRYYTKREYRGLSTAQKKELQQLIEMNQRSKMEVRRVRL